MGQQQRLLTLVASLFVVTAAVATALMLFSDRRIAVNRDGIISELNALMADAHQYKARPGSLGGGGGSYDGYRIPANLDTTGSGYYSVIREEPGPGTTRRHDPTLLVLVGVSAENYGTVRMELDGRSGDKKIILSGDFLP